MIKEARFTSVWDGGQIIMTKCKVNLDTKEVFDIDTIDVEGLENLEREYITIDGKECTVSRKDEGIETEYHYE